MWQVESLPNGNETTVFYDDSMCGDFDACHTEPPTCNCD